MLFRSGLRTLATLFAGWVEKRRLEEQEERQQEVEEKERAEAKAEDRKHRGRRDTICGLKSLGLN